MNTQTHKIINKKWVIQILLLLQNGKRYSYRKIKDKTEIPNSTLALRVVELEKYNFITRYVYGSKSKPHYTNYEITQIGLNHLNSLLF